MQQPGSKTGSNREDEDVRIKIISEGTSPAGGGQNSSLQVQSEASNLLELQDSGTKPPVPNKVQTAKAALMRNNTNIEATETKGLSHGLLSGKRASDTLMTSESKQKSP